MTTNGTKTYMAVVEKSLSYDPVNDFTPISLVGKYGLLMVVNPSVPAKTLPEFLTYARDPKNKGKINYATSGMGSGLHFAGELFNAMAKIDMVHVPYKGAAPALNDLAAGQVNLMFNSALAVAPMVKDGRIRLLAQTGAQRSPALPADLPTVAETLGLTGFQVTGWFGLLWRRGSRSRLSCQHRSADCYGC